MNARGVSLRRLGRYGEPMRSFEQAIAAAPADRDWHANLTSITAESRSSA